MALNTETIRDLLAQSGEEPEAADLLTLPCAYAADDHPYPADKGDQLEIVYGARAGVLMRVRESGTLVTIALSPASVLALGRWCAKHSPA